MEPTTTLSSDAGAARRVVERVRESAASQLSTQKGRATEGLDNLAQAARRSTQALRDSQQDAVARYVDQAADRIERFSTRLREQDAAEVIRDVQQFARRRPALFIGATFALGMVAVRFLKSSDRNTAYGEGRRLGVNRYEGETSPTESSSIFDIPADAPSRHDSGGL
jgi:exonuclease VII large subunit